MSHAMTTLQGAIRTVTDPALLMQRVVDQSLLLIRSADGAAVELADQAMLTYVCTAGSLTGHVGVRLRIDDSLSGLAVRLGRTLRCDDSGTDSRVNAEMCRRVGAISMVCVPLRDRGRAVGVLKVTSGAMEAFDEDDVAVLTRLAGFVTEIIASAESLDRQVADLLNNRPDGVLNAELSRFVANVIHPGLAPNAETRRRIEDVLDQEAFTFLYQPIVRLADGRVVGYEALARFGGSASPDVWFTEAHRVGLGIDLELAAARRASEALASIERSAYLAINVGPELALSRALLALVEELPADRLVIELTEHVHIDDYPSLLQAIAVLRSRGARLAIDDTGTGYAGLAQLLELGPDVIKLDRILTTGIDRDPARRALAAALVGFAAESGATVIAEGIETAGELETVKQLGITHGQGYHVGRPAPIGASSVEEPCVDQTVEVIRHQRTQRDDSVAVVRDQRADDQ